ncbi:hypothetical protein [Williamsia sp. R60]
MAENDDDKIRAKWETAVKHVLDKLAAESAASRVKELAEAYSLLAASPARYDD